MNFETPSKKIENFLNGIIGQSGKIFQVGVKISQGNDIVVLLDGDDGITIEKCTQVNKALYKYIEEAKLFPGGNFSLEVSSPGVDEPLKFHRQYRKNIGRNVQVIMNDGSLLEGKLIEVNNDEIILKEKQVKGSKAPDRYRDKTTTISFNQIKHTKVLVTF